MSLAFAVILSTDNEPMRQAMSQICELLSHDSGLEIEPLCVATPSMLAQALANEQAQFAWLSPTLLLIAKPLATMVPLLSSVRDGAAFFHSVVFSSARSNIHSVADLDGCRAAWVAPSSASGYLVARLTLAREGVDVTAFDSEEFLGAHGAVAKSVFSGQSDIGATYAHFHAGKSFGEVRDTGYSNACPEEEANVICVSGPIPADMVVAHPSVPIADRVAFAGAMCRMPHDPVGGGAVAQVIGADDFREVTYEALDELQQLMAAARELEV